MNIISWILTILLLLKTIEMLIQSIITSRFTEFSEAELKKSFPISRFVNKVRLGKLFRVPVLILFSSIIAYFPECLSDLTLYVLASAIFVTLWVLLFHSFAIRFNLGSSDKYLRYFNFDYQWGNLNQRLPNIDTNINQRHIILYIVALVFVTMLGYSPIYLTVAHYDPSAFTGASNSAIDYLYFSVVSFTTVGYGDILPKSDFSKLLVISEIVYSFGVLVMLILTYSTTTPDK